MMLGLSSSILGDGGSRESGIGRHNWHFLGLAPHCTFIRNDTLS